MTNFVSVTICIYIHKMFEGQWRVYKSNNNYECRSVFRDVIPCRQGKLPTFRISVVLSSSNSTWRWSQLYLPQRTYSGHGLTSKKTLIFNNTAVINSNLTRGMSVQIIPLTSSTKCALAMIALTLTLLTWRIWWAPNNASKWRMGFNSAFKGLNQSAVDGIFYHIVKVKVKVTP